MKRQAKLKKQQRMCQAYDRHTANKKCGNALPCPCYWHRKPEAR